MSQASSRTTGMESEKQRIVRLQVGESETAFVTTHHTLCKESAFFQALLSDQNQQLPNGTHFVDADPKLFAHILRYLQHGIYPVSFTPGKGHNLTTYLGIERLVQWVADKQYESAIECSVTYDRVIPYFNLYPHTMTRSHSSMDHVHLITDSNGQVWEIKKRFTAGQRLFWPNHRGRAIRMF